MTLATAISAPAQQVTLIGIADSSLAASLAAEIERWDPRPVVSVAKSLLEVRESAGRGRAAVIVLDSDLLPAPPFVPVLRSLMERAPVVLLGPGELNDDLLHLIAQGQLEFVPRGGRFIPLAASLIERRLRWSGAANFGFAAAGVECDSLKEVFRHEINNPLTGILGNAEMLLAHRDHLRLVDAQRLQTIVELSVRLRETIRRISDNLEPGSRPVRDLLPH